MLDDKVFDLKGHRFNRVIIDISISIELYDTNNYLRINTEGSFVINQSGSSSMFNVEHMHESDRLLNLLDRALSQCIATGKGDLLVFFEDGTSFTIGGDDEYETWHLYTEQSELHSTPGGGYTIYSK